MIRNPTPEELAPIHALRSELADAREELARIESQARYEEHRLRKLCGAEYGHILDPGTCTFWGIIAGRAQDGTPAIRPVPGCEPHPGDVALAKGGG